MKVQIFFIYADDCSHCKSALLMIENIVSKVKVKCEIMKYLFDTPAALGIAVNNDIDDLPGIVISGNNKKYIFKGKGYSEEKLLDAISKASK